MRRSSRRRRDTSDIANRRLPRVVKSSRTISFRHLYSSPLTIFEDRRSFHPEGRVRPAASFNRSRHRLSLVASPPASHIRRGYTKLPSLWDATKARIGFDVPDKVLVCVRRKMRREVLHAFRKTGKRGQRSPRFNFFSKISCRK